MGIFRKASAIALHTISFVVEIIIMIRKEN